MPSRSQSQSVILLHTPVRRRRMTSPSPSASDLQSHLYQSFLTRKTTDVALNVSGASWHAVYHLHRVVLIQSVCILHHSTVSSSSCILNDHAGILPLTLHLRILGNPPRAQWHRAEHRYRIRRFQYYSSWWVLILVFTSAFSHSTQRLSKPLPKSWFTLS